jgi:hypothetical protein
LAVRQRTIGLDRIVADRVSLTDPRRKSRRISMRRLIIVAAALALALSAVGVVLANSDSNKGSFKASLGGFQEVPAISTTGTGRSPPSSTMPGPS